MVYLSVQDPWTILRVLISIGLVSIFLYALLSAYRALAPISLRRLVRLLLLPRSHLDLPQCARHRASPSMADPLARVLQTGGCRSSTDGIGPKALMSLRPSAWLNLKG